MKCPLRSTNKRFLLNTLRSTGLQMRTGEPRDGHSTTRGRRRGDSPDRHRDRSRTPSRGIITGTAVTTKIRRGTETESGVTGAKTTEAGDMRGTPTTETKTGLMSKDRLKVGHCFFYKGPSFCREHRGGHSSEQLTRLTVG